MNLRLTLPRRTLPKVLWTLWLQGWDEAPPLMRACLASWRSHNPGWEIRALDSCTLREFLDPAAAFPSVAGKWLPPEAFSNLVRGELLRRHGGVWADSTAFCTRPLDDWIEDCATSGFFAFERPFRDRMLSNWFLAARPGNPLVARWADAARAYWDGRSARDEFFWHHRLFAGLYDADPVVRRIWDATPKLSADSPHSFMPYEEKLPAPITAADRERVESGVDPLYKLSRHVEGGPGSALDYFVSRGHAAAA